MVLEGGQPNVYVRLQGGEGGQKCPEFCLRGLYTVPSHELSVPRSEDNLLVLMMVLDFEG